MNSTPHEYLSAQAAALEEDAARYDKNAAELEENAQRYRARAEDARRKAASFHAAAAQIADEPADEPAVGSD